MHSHLSMSAQQPMAGFRVQEKILDKLSAPEYCPGPKLRAGLC